MCGLKWVSCTHWGADSPVWLLQMPPKKGGEAPKPPPLIGRFGTSLKIGIVGLPNVGYVNEMIELCRQSQSLSDVGGNYLFSSFRWSVKADQGRADVFLTFCTAGSPPSSTCSPRVRPPPRTSRSAPSTQMRAGCPFPTSAMTTSASSTSRPGMLLGQHPCIFFLIFPKFYLFFPISV